MPKFALLTLAFLLLATSTWFVLKPAPLTVETTTAIPLHVKVEGDTVLSAGDTAIQRMKTPPSKPKELVQLCQAHFLWNEKGSLGGTLIHSETSRSFDFEFAKGEDRVLTVPPGQYKITLRGGVRSVLDFVILHKGATTILCYSGLSGNIQLWNQGSPAPGVRVFATNGVHDHWRAIGTTDQEGMLSFLGHEKLTRLLFFRKDEILMVARDFGGLHRSPTPHHFEVSPHFLWNVEAHSGLDGHAIPNAKIYVANILVGTTNAQGQLQVRASKDASKFLSATAAGFAESARALPAPAGDPHQLVAELQPVRAQNFYAVGQESGEPIGHARLLFFSGEEADERQLLAECLSAEDGSFQIPSDLSSGDTLVAWHSAGLLGLTNVGRVVESGRIALEQTAPLILVPPSGGEGAQIHSCKTISMWGEETPAQLLEDGKLCIPGAFGTQTILVELKSKAILRLSRSAEYDYRRSFLLPDLTESIAGELTLPELQLHSQVGFLQGMDASIQEGDALEVSFHPFDFAMDTYSEWPSLGGAQPSQLKGWNWQNQSLTFRTLVDAKGNFKLEGLPSGRGSFHVKNFSDGNALIPVNDKSWVTIPTAGAIPVELIGTTPLNLVVSSSSGGPSPERVTVEFTNSSTFDSPATKQQNFFSPIVRTILPNNELKKVRVVATGFHPKEITLDSQASSKAPQNVRLDPLQSMVIHLVDNRTAQTPGSLFAYFGRLAPGSLFSSMGNQTMDFASGPTWDFFGAYPGCDVLLNVKPYSSGVLSVSRFTFEPGATLEIVLED